MNAGDTNLGKHVVESARNATYTSPDIQNEIIEVCSNLVTEKVVGRISLANCSTILADETMDISGTEQLSMCARYVDEGSQDFPIIFSKPRRLSRFHSDI